MRNSNPGGTVGEQERNESPPEDLTRVVEGGQGRSTEEIADTFNLNNWPSVVLVIGAVMIIALVISASLGSGTTP